MDESDEEAFKQWFPYWKRPVSPDEWDKLVSQRAAWAISSSETYRNCVAIDAPLMLRQMVAKSRYTLLRKYWRTKRRAESEKRRLCENLLRVIFGEDGKR